MHNLRDVDYCPLFWQTKSALQPRGDRDEFELAKSTMPSKIQRWINRGKQDSALRPGKIDLNKEKVTTLHRGFETKTSNLFCCDLYN